MGKNLFVGNLAHELTDAELQDVFEQCGEVVSARVIMDRDTGRSRGFGFVEMQSEDGAKAAVEELDGKEVGGRAIRVNEARPRENSGGGGFNRGGGGGGGGRRR